MRLRDNFPLTEKQAEIFDVEISDPINVFRIFEIDDPSSLAALEKKIHEVNRFLEKNGYEPISAIDFIKNDFDYESENAAVKLVPDAYSSDKLILHIERENFINLNNDILQLLKSFFQDLKVKTVGYEPSRFLHEVIDQAKLLPKRPLKDCFVSYEYNNSTFSIAFSDYKIELDCYVQDLESYKSHYYYFGFDGTTEAEGNFDQYREELFKALENVKVTDISISDEE